MITLTFTSILRQIDFNESNVHLLIVSLTDSLAPFAGRNRASLCWSSRPRRERWRPGEQTTGQPAHRGSGGPIAKQLSSVTTTVGAVTPPLFAGAGLAIEPAATRRGEDIRESRRQRALEPIADRPSALRIAEGAGRERRRSEQVRIS
jgi:hypothetical protein